MVYINTIEALGRLSKAACLVYLAHSALRDLQTNVSAATQERVADLTSLSTRSVRRAEGDLAAAGLIATSTGSNSRSVLVSPLVSDEEDADVRHSDPDAAVREEDRAVLVPGRCCPGDPDRAVRVHHYKKDLEIEEREGTRAHVAEVVPTDSAAGADHTHILLGLYHELVEPYTSLDTIREASVSIHCRVKIDAHWRRYDGDLETFRTAFERWVKTERMWACAGVGFVKLWDQRKGGSESWFDALAQNTLADKWWTEPFAEEPRPKLSQVLRGDLHGSVRYGVEVDVDLALVAPERYCSVLRERVPHVVRKLVADARETAERGRSLGADEEAVLEHLSSHWKPNQEHARLLGPLVAEALR